MTDNLTPLTAGDHWLGWLGDDPGQAVRQEIARILREQVPTAELEWLRLVDKPYFLTGGRQLPEVPGKIIVTRAALAVSFELQVRSVDEVEQLRGVFSWVAVGLDGARRDHVHFDLRAELAWASEQLKLRIYELDMPAEPLDAQ
jgi:hypothetical protein